MKDEEYLFIQDQIEKKSIGRSARNKRTHNGKRGRVKLPSDYKTKKEIAAMSGECKSYRLNEPMKWAEFRAMSEDLQVQYIKAIQMKWNVPGTYIADMLDVNRSVYHLYAKKLGVTCGKRSGRMKWDKEGFLRWVNGVPAEELGHLPENDEVEVVLDEIEIPVEVTPPVCEEEPVLETPKVEEPANVALLNYTLLSINDVQTITRALGILEGICYGVESEIRNGILSAVQMIDGVICKEEV